MAGFVPEITSLAIIYADFPNAQSISSEHVQRWKRLQTTFSNKYGHKPDFVARSPGRVNIIGEHIDYSLYNVLPTAVTVDTLIAVKSSQQNIPTIKIANIKPNRYPSSEFQVPIQEDVEIDPARHEWINYFKAGLRGALGFLRKKHGDSFIPASMELIVDGNVPAGGGLSSSAALVCASALAVMKANGHNVSKEDLLDISVSSERAVGVYSGGMDQAASIFSEMGYLLYCRFYPKFKAEHVPVPQSEPEISFIIAQSFVTSDKAVTAPKHYNLRVVECTLAAVVLARMHDLVLNTDGSSLGFSLRGFQQEYMKRVGRLDDSLEDQVDAMIRIAKDSLIRDDGYTREEISEILRISVETLESKYMSKFPVQAERFLLRQRAVHVYEEARRVLEFRDTLSHADKLTDEKVRYLGDLMNKTQESCRGVYDCSCPEIDDICSIARNAGSYGSRLTGAGWGGCTVHLVPQDKVDAVTEALKKEYYFKNFPGISEEKLVEAIVISKPSKGSTIINGAALGM